MITCKPSLFYQTPIATTTSVTSKYRGITSSEKSFQHWSIFRKQDEAFDDLNSSPLSLHIFSFEFDKELPGIRKFLVTTLDEFYLRYKSMPAESRNFYEIILQNRYCHLYFDIEYAIDLNPNSDPISMMRIFKELLFKEIKSKFGIFVTEKDVIDLDSTTDKKFSRHLIIHMKDSVFANNIEIGKFVSELVLKLKLLSYDSTSTSFDVDSIFIKDKDGQRTLFIDQGVYSKNRQFRILNSSKIGKDAFLIYSTENKYKSRIPNPTPTDLFLSTLVGFVPYNQNLRVLRVAGHITASNENQKQVKYQPSLDKKSKSSDYSKIDHFLKNYISQFGIQPHIKSVRHYPESETLIYGIEGSRYCHRISRHHKSNGVYYVVDLKHGVFKQRCFDPDCIGYTSEPITLPLCLFEANREESHQNEQISCENIGELEEIDFQDIPDTLFSILDESQ